ncbi:MAG: hypothetical protein ACP5SQ_03315 [Candidatus Saccharicenans sp.]
MKKKAAVIFFIAFFFFFSSAIDFFHNHKTIQEPTNCPAGQFLKVFASADAVFVSFLIFFIFLRIISFFCADRDKSIFIFSSISRSPPLN